MKPFFFFLLFLGLQISLFAQENNCPHFKRLLQEAQQALDKGDYEMAMNKYNSARAHCPTRTGEVDAAVNLFFQRLNGLREEAIESKKEADILKRRFKESIYFHNDTLGLAYKAGIKKWGYIDTALRITVPYIFDEASVFDESTGFATVRLNASDSLNKNKAIFSLKENVTFKQKGATFWLSEKENRLFQYVEAEMIFKRQIKKPHVLGLDSFALSANIIRKLKSKYAKKVKVVRLYSSTPFQVSGGSLDLLLELMNQFRNKSLLVLNGTFRNIERMENLEVLIIDGFYKKLDIRRLKLGLKKVKVEKLVFKSCQLDFLADEKLSLKETNVKKLVFKNCQLDFLADEKFQTQLLDSNVREISFMGGDFINLSKEQENSIVQFLFKLRQKGVKIYRTNEVED